MILLMLLLLLSRQPAHVGFVAADGLMSVPLMERVECLH